MKNLQKWAFTLAEVLITLAIIGIVAGMIIPSIVAGNQKLELEARFAKAYRTIMHTVDMAAAEHGSFETWDWKETSWSSKEKDEFAKTYFAPYLNVLKFCPTDSIKGCVPDTMYKWINGSDMGKLTEWKHPVFLLADGSFMIINFVGDCFNQNSRCLDVFIDTNGHRKPNVRGLDLQIFSFYPQTGEFLPYGINAWKSYDKTTNSFRKSTLEEIYAKCRKGARGDYCTARIVADGFKINF